MPVRLFFLKQAGHGFCSQLGWSVCTLISANCAASVLSGAISFKLCFSCTNLQPRNPASLAHHLSEAQLPKVL